MEVEKKTTEAKRSADTLENQDKKKPKKIFEYGNYDGYYAIRVPSGEMDDRMSQFKKAWFTTLRVLDIGCNVGKLTMNIANKFEPAHITGIDIDESLIERANTFLGNKKQKLPPRSWPKAFEVMLGPLKYQPFPHNVSFIASNILEWEPQTPDTKFDVIMCLSTSKWIHLNFGDEGIKKLFSKVYNLLDEGGLFIFEPQEWRSYKKKHTLTPRIKENYQKIQFRPASFEDYLTNTIKFELLHKMEPQKSTGFDRPILILKKPFTTKPTASKNNNNNNDNSKNDSKGSSNNNNSSNNNDKPTAATASAPSSSNSSNSADTTEATPMSVDTTPTTTTAPTTSTTNTDTNTAATTNTTTAPTTTAAATTTTTQATSS